MKPVEILVDILDHISVSLLGLHFNLGNALVLGALFALGFLLGKLTRGIGFWKAIAALILGVYLYDLLAHARYPFVGAVLLGFLVKHSYLYWGVLSWARSLGDIIFALRYRRAFEDIKRREAELDERERQLKEQLRANTRTERESATQQQWREQAKARKEKQGQSSGSGNASSSGSNSGGKSRQEKPQGAAGKPSDSIKAQHLRVMELDPTTQYSKDELKRAYRKRAKETHPDVLGGSSAAFRELAEAYQWLCAQ